jgi:hypothetical protein
MQSTSGMLAILISFLGQRSQRWKSEMYFSILVWLMLGSATVVAQKAERELSKSFAAAAPFHSAATKDMVVRSVLTDTGEIAIVVEMPNIQTGTSWWTTQRDTSDRKLVRAIHFRTQTLCH